MRGLSPYVYKDFCSLSPHMFRYFRFFALYFVLCFLGVISFLFAIVMVEFLVMMLPISLFFFDHTCGFDRYAIGLSGGRANFVGGRYCFCFGCSLFFTIIMLIFLVIIEKYDHIPTLFAIYSLGVNLQSLLLPVHFHLGCTRAKPWYFLIALCVLTPILLLLSGEGGNFFLPEVTMVNHPVLLLIMVILIVFLVFYCSYLVSRKIVAKKDFL